MVSFLCGECPTFVFLVMWYFSIFWILFYLIFFVFPNSFIQWYAQEGKSRHWIEHLDSGRPMIMLTDLFLSVYIIWSFFSLLLLGFSVYKSQWLVYLYQHICPSEPPHDARLFIYLIICNGGVSFISFIIFESSSNYEMFSRLTWNFCNVVWVIIGALPLLFSVVADVCSLRT